MDFVVYYNGSHVKDGMETIPATINYPDILLLIMLGLSTITCFVVITSTLWSDKARVEGFNLYLIFLLIPDACFVLQRFIIKLISVLSNVRPFPSTFFCTLAPIISGIYIHINLWMDVLIVYETYQLLLEFSHQDRRYHQSSRRVVIRRVSIVYVLSVIGGVTYVINIRPFHDVRLDSKTCVARFYGNQSYLVYYIYGFLFFVTPCLYLLYVVFTVHKNKLLPQRSSSTRFLALYFFRIAFVSSGLIITGLIVVKLNIYEVFPAVVSVQSFFISFIAVTKQDIRQAVVDTFSCSCNRFSLFYKADRVRNATDIDPISLPNQ